VDYKHLNKTEVRGYLKPDSAFRTLNEWKLLAQTLIEVQSKGFDTRSGEISCKNAQFCSTEEYDNFVMLIKEYFGFLLVSEVERWDLLTRKNVLDFIEDFVNHRVWGIEQEYGSYFTDIGKLRFAYFYSRGDIEPYVLLDEEYTRQTLNDTGIKKTLLHYASPKGVARMQKSIAAGNKFDISSFTRSQRPFFRGDSTLVVKFVGNVIAAFRSDIKSMATDSGNRACNLYRLQYPGDDLDNICRDPEDCADDAVRTDLWNEFIATPVEILKVYKAPTAQGISLSSRQSIRKHF
jgi:hypothetical protein